MSSEVHFDRLLSAIDKDKDGHVSEDDVLTAVKMFKSFRDASSSGWALNLKMLPENVAAALRDLDDDDTGLITISNLQRAAGAHRQRKERARRLRMILVLGVVFLFLMLGCMFGLAFAVVELSKETTVSADGSLTKYGSSELVRTGSAETRVNGTVMTTKEGDTISVAQAPLLPATMSSLLPDSALNELRIFSVSADSGAYISLQVLGWARVPSALSLGGSYVKIVTSTGTVKIDGSTLTFDDLVGNLFEELGFVTDTSGRRLLGIYELIGLFNSVKEWQYLEETERAPGFDGDFLMEYTARYPCTHDNFTCQTGPNYTYLGGYNDGYIEIQYSTQRDIDSDSSLEVMSNPEWPGDSLSTFKSAEAAHTAQYHGGAYFHCTTDYLSPTHQEPTDSDSDLGSSGSRTSFNITRAAKISETTLDDGSIERQFEMDVAMDIISYIFLMDDAEATGYDGTVTITYFDDKSTGHPKKILYDTGLELIINKYDPTPVDLSGWELPLCETDAYASAKVSKLELAPYAANYQRRREENCTKNEFDDCIYAPRTNLTIEGVNRHLLSPLESADLFEALLEDFRGAGEVHYLNGYDSGAVRHLTDYATCSDTCPSCDDTWSSECCSCDCDQTTRQSSFGLGPFGALGIKRWDAGCGVHSAWLDVSCGSALTCYGKCYGETPLLVGGDWGFTCGVGVKFDLLGKLPTWLRKVLPVEFSVYLEVGYQYETKLYFKGGGAAGILATSSWTGSWGAEFGFGVGGTVDVGDGWFEVRMWVSGK
eukprot:gene27319-33652_t